MIRIILSPKFRYILLHMLQLFPLDSDGKNAGTEFGRIGHHQWGNFLVQGLIMVILYYANNGIDGFGSGRIIRPGIKIEFIAGDPGAYRICQTEVFYRLFIQHQPKGIRGEVFGKKRPCFSSRPNKLAYWSPT